MFRRKQLRREAARVRGRMDRRAGLLRQRIDRLIHRVYDLARSPAALPVAFISGILAERLRPPGIKRAYTILTALAGPSKALQIATTLIGSSLR